MTITSESGDLAGRVAVVTGGTGGIGQAICRTLAEAGCRVVPVFRTSQSRADTLVASLVGSGHFAVQADVTDGGSLRSLAETLEARCETVEILVNCVGTTRFVKHDDLDGLDDDLIDTVFRTNWRGPFATIRALKALLARQRGGVVVNISSIAAISGIGSNVAYCASKAALNAMTVSLARALAPTIRVIGVAPGLVDTEFIQNLDAAWRQDQVSRTPLGRLATPLDVSRAVLAAINLEGSTGCVIPVDGGRLLS